MRKNAIGGTIIAEHREALKRGVQLDGFEP